jgi:hypothetical protein
MRFTDDARAVGARSLLISSSISWKFIIEESGLGRRGQAVQVESKEVYIYAMTLGLRLVMWLLVTGLVWLGS